MKNMQTRFPLDTQEAVLHLDRAGLATRARLAAESVARGRTAVLVAGSRESFQALQGLAVLFTPELSARPVPPDTPAWARSVISLPPGLLLRSGPSVWASRLASLYALSLGAPRIVVASAGSLLVRYPPRDFFLNNTLEIAKGADWPQDLLLDQLIEWGFVRVPMVTNPGEVARRGDILDIFAPGYTRPLRLEFFGDTVDGLRVFDPDSQRSVEDTDSLTVIPAAPYLSDAKSLDLAEQRFQKLFREGKITENMSYACRKALRETGRALMPGVVHENASLLEDWLPKGSFFFCDGENDTREVLEEAWDDAAEKLSAEDASPQQPSSLCLRSRDAAPVQGGTTVYSEPLVVGVEQAGIDMCEHELHSFQEVFTDPGAMDRPWLQMSAALKTWMAEKNQVLLSFSTDRARKKFLKLCETEGIAPRLRYSPDEKGLFALLSSFRKGSELLWDNSIILGEGILFPKAERSGTRSTRAFKGMDSFEDLKEGELLVHRDYGIGRFRGLKRIDMAGTGNDFLVMEYQGSDSLYVPVDRLSLIQRFKGGDGAEPALDKLGGSRWNASKERARKAIEKIAADLVEMYAYRKVAKGFSYPPVNDLYREFESTFGFEETPDQAKAIADVLRDMEREEPMDRLICGDVGFGKTEVAMRAAFRAATEGRQVALLCPTTVLAEQHYQTFRARMSGFPVNVGLLSRFVSGEKQKEVIREAARGQIDILIGTHRLLSSDVELPNLALLILDEEQRFGVRHKEMLKSLKKNVDVLTLTATPIPRTLQLSMSGIRDLSIIETAPQDRKPVESLVLNRDEKTLREVVKREMERGGQVFWVYNRVQGLGRVAEFVHRLVPEARIAMAHGKMNEEEVEDNMRRFWHGELDVLVCTSLVESGLDFPRANTLIVDQAQNFGLGQLYQLRGRVGRSDRQAYAYFVVPDKDHLTKLAEERLRIILEMDYLGAGFKVAMEDLRLRGAGNILGEAQSGQITRVGLDLYLEMLAQAVDRLRGTPEVQRVETELNIGVPARIPETYIEDGQERLRYYKELTTAPDGPAREQIALSLRDRFGPFPEDFQNFLAVLDFKQFLTGLQVQKADLSLKHVKLCWAEGQTASDPVRILTLANQTHGAKLTPPATLILPVQSDKPFREALAALRAELESVRAGDASGDGEKAQTEPEKEKKDIPSYLNVERRPKPRKPSRVKSPAPDLQGLTVRVGGVKRRKKVAGQS